MSQFPMDFNTLYGMYQQRRMMNQPSPLAAAYNQQFNMGNYNNEARYGDIIGGRTGIYDRNMDRINSLGAQEREDINRRADQMLSSQRSDLVSRGLGGTTVRQSIENKNLEDRNRALRQQSDNEVRQRIATDSSLADNVYATMERRNDITPDLGQLAQLQQAVGASGMYGQYPGMGGMGPGVGGAGGGGQFSQFPPSNTPYGGISGGNGGWGAGARQPVGRPGNRLPGYDNSQGRSIGGMGGVSNMGPGVGGAGGSAGGYPLPGGGTSTPTYMPQPFPGPGQMPGQGGWNPGMTLPGNGMISKYRDGDRVGQAMESQLLSQLRNVGQPRPGGYRPSAGYGSQQPQGGGMIRTAGDISRTPQQQINDYMQNRMRDNVYGINPNPTFKGMGGPPTFTIGGMPQYMTAQQPIYNYEMYGGGGRQRVNMPSGAAPAQAASQPRMSASGLSKGLRGAAGRLGTGMMQGYGGAARGLGQGINDAVSQMNIPMPNWQAFANIRPAPPVAGGPTAYDQEYGFLQQPGPAWNAGAPMSNSNPYYSTSAIRDRLPQKQPMSDRDKQIATQNYNRYIDNQMKANNQYDYGWFGNTAEAANNAFLNTMDAIGTTFGFSDKPKYRSMYR